MPLAVGTIVAGYRIEAVLGSGGMGTVYLARHPNLPRSDALKILSSELSVDRQFRTRFIREADLAASLNHPNIVTVFDRGQTDDGQLWIAMQYVEGTAASDLDRQYQTLERIVRIIGDVAAALDYAHSRRILHRDIKPSNFLVASPGTTHERVLLADFGIARALDDATALTATGLLVGTAAYAAPEAIEGGHVDHRTDIYSLGCALFRLLTGRTPYDESGSLPAMLAGHLMRPIPRASQIAPGLAPAIDDVLARALAKNPADRFNTAGDFAAATAAALTDHVAPPGYIGTEPTNRTNPTLTYPPTWPPVPGPAHGPRTPPPDTPAAQHYSALPHPPPLNAAPPQRRRTRRRLILAATTLIAVIAVIAGVSTYLLGHTSGGLAPYHPQSLTGKFGTTKLDHRPAAVAALGPGDPDAVLSLGVQPVAMTEPQGSAPSWLQSLVRSSTPVLATPDPAAISATKPDLIIDTGDIDHATYSALSAIAPTLTRPADNPQDWDWQKQLSWIATALGRSDTAKSILNDAAAQQNKIKSDHPAFSGKSIVVVNYTGTTTTAATDPSAPTSYVKGLGFTYSTHYKRSPSDPPDTPFNIDDFNYVGRRTDVLLLLRTDPGAGGGGYSGLPAKYNGYGGILVIVDDPSTITALNTGGPTATAYLNTALVNKLSNQIH
ncbi:serine/threonine-protein kinase [Mycobacterium heidelbergense]|uniref:serine/threonine-protein kinase n=1 Tax=Mycobacterium heidelbergense TaxID=53376 RepID=UPI003CF5FFE0